MTRKKKTRSMKRIHNVKTGSKSKLKKAGDSDRQTKSRFGKTVKKQKSVYQKYIEENQLKDETSGIQSEAIEADMADSKAVNDENNQDINRDKNSKAKESTEDKKQDSRSIFDEFEKSGKNNFY